MKVRNVPPYEKITESRASTLPILSGFDENQTVEFYENRREREEETEKGRNREKSEVCSVKKVKSPLEIKDKPRRAG